MSKDWIRVKVEWREDHSAVVVVTSVKKALDAAIEGRSSSRRIVSAMMTEIEDKPEQVEPASENGA